MGSLGAWLGLENGAACLILWKSEQPATMLINVSVVQGKSWLRPFLPRLCRATTATAIDRLFEDGKSPDYAACILVHRPDRSDGDRHVAIRAYEIGSDRKFALMTK